MFTAFWPLVVPVRLALTFAPPEQVADTVPATEVADCSEITHFKSVQLLTGSPASEEEPHAPENADAGVLPELLLDVEELVPAGAMLPAAPALPVGAVGVRISDVCSNPQPGMSIDTRMTARKESVFMVRPVVIGAQLEGARRNENRVFLNWKRPGGDESIAERGRPRTE